MRARARVCDAALGGRYEGEWDDDERHGHGILYHENGDMFEGTFRLGNLHGPVTITWKKGGRVRKAIYQFGMRKRWVSAREAAADSHIAELLQQEHSSDGEDDGDGALRMHHP